MKLIVTDIPAQLLPPMSDSCVIEADEKKHPCIGCFGCWTKTPGQCVIHDGLENTGAWLGASERLIIISRCCFGSTSPAVKNVLDRAISYIHPYFVMRHGEMHHASRYGNHLRICAHLYGALSAKEEETAQAILERNAINYDGTLDSVYFYPCREVLLKEVRL